MHPKRRSSFFVAQYNVPMILLLIFCLFFNFPQIVDGWFQTHQKKLHKKSPCLLARVVLIVVRDKQTVIDWLVEHGKIIDKVGG